MSTQDTDFPHTLSPPTPWFAILFTSCINMGHVKELMARNVLNFSKNIHLQIQEAELIPNRIMTKRTVPRHIAMKLEK